MPTGPMDWDEIEKRLAREAADEERQAQADRDQKMDDTVEPEIAELLGMSMGEFKAALARDIPNLSEKDTKRAIEAVYEAHKALKGGFFSSPDPAKAQKILKGNEHTKAMGEKRKGFLGCAVVGVLMLGGVAGSVAGAVSGLAALFG